MLNLARLIIGTLATVLAIIAWPAKAASVEVKWDDVKSFTDIEAVSGRQDRFEADVMKGLSEHVNELAQQLPAENKLVVIFNDVDIAGRIEPTFGALSSSHQRILDDLSYPELVISFQYTNAQGDMLVSGDMVDLKSLAPMSTRRSTMAAGRDNLYHEKRLLTRWFNDTFSQ